MKFIHLSDLHIGKRVNEFSMLEDQEYILTEIINIIDRENTDCVMIAGDVYDKSVPSAEAVQLFDDFLCRLARRKLQVFVISGNHDSPERIAFGSRLMNMSGIHMSPVYNGHVDPFEMHDEYGTVNIYMLPFVKPANVRLFENKKEISTYTDALRAAVEEMNIDTSRRNIIVTHQFVTGAMRSDSEEISVGGTDNVDASVFECFDYTALGHIHKPQNIISEKIRYCGTPLKYSFSEANNIKSVTVAELNEKNNLSVRTIPLVPKYDMREIKGTYAELTLKSTYESINCNDYMHITLTDEENIPDAIGKLKVIYPKIMKLDYDNKRTRSAQHFDEGCEAESKSPIELFTEFYQKQNNQPMCQEQLKFSEQLIQKIWEDKV